jgi:predicted NBD/HSP70 family sugar kinase
LTVSTAKKRKTDMQILGIDVGGTGIKGAIVETATGALVQGQGDSKYPPAKPGELPE